MTTFEVGKFYEHSSGEKFAILGRLDTTLYGDNVLIAEASGEANFRPVGDDETSATNYHEITRERWMESFNGEGKAVRPVKQDNAAANPLSIPHE